MKTDYSEKASLHQHLEKIREKLEQIPEGDPSILIIQTSVITIELALEKALDRLGK